MMLVLLLGVSGLVGAAGAGDGVVLQEGGGGEPLGSDLFDDVPVGHWADEEVGWAVSSGVMGGVADGGFDLEGVVPRWQIVAFLFRASRLVGGSVGDEELVGSDGFSDVPVGHEADREIGWAVSSGITQGVGGGRFGPDGSVTRAQIVTFLFRLTGLVDGPVAAGGVGSDRFLDVPVGHWADEEVGWAVMNGVTRGVGDGLFDLDQVVTRAQIATFLFRVVQFVEGSGVGGLGVVAEPRLLVGRAHRSGDWSPDGGRVVFSQDGSLWVVDVDTGDRSLLLARVGGEILEDPAWSPDGTKIAYSRGWQNNAGHWVSHIYSVNVDGTAQTQLSSSDVRDWRPGWSPDSERIVFQRLSGTGRDDNGRFVDADRYIVVMDADGSNQIPLTDGGRWEQSPVWSSDGARIAYLSDNSVGIVDSDGNNPTPTPTGGAFWDGGVSWSPDGKRLAFARRDGTGSSIVIVEIEGLTEETVTDADGWDTMPRWSPDGQKLLFTRQQPDGTQQLFVVDASGRRSPFSCKPRGLDDYTAGFPLPAWVAPSTGQVKLTVLFMDFPNAQATYTTHTEIQNGFSYMVEYLEAMSYGQLDIEVDVVHQWWRASKDFEAYLGISPIGTRSLFRGASAEAVRLADDSYDFSDTDMFVTVFPSQHFARALAGGRAQADGKTFPGFWMNGHVAVDHGVPSPLGLMAAHELVHELGLADLYPWDRTLRELPNPPRGQRWVYSEIGLMGLNTNFASTNRTLGFVGPVEMLTWSRWQLGWLDPSQIQCDVPPGGSVTLQPVAEPGTGTVMAAIPLNLHQIIVIENRRKRGYDAAPPPVHQSGGEASHGLIEEGVLVYTVDTLIGNGQLPIKIANEIGTVQYDSFPVLTVGESITLHGHTITVTNDTHPTYTITITKTD